jgi:hypothetical protein
MSDNDGMRRVIEADQPSNSIANDADILLRDVIGSSEGGRPAFIRSFTTTVKEPLK